MVGGAFRWLLLAWLDVTLMVYLLVTSMLHSVFTVHGSARALFHNH